MTVARRGDRVRRLAAERLGFDELRPGQLEGVESVLKGRDTLCVMSTGSGKTAIYELAGMMLDGPTVVVSPLIALQRDQVEAIEGEDVEAAVLNSTLSERAREETLEEAEEGEVEFLTGERTIRGGPGTYVAVPQGVLHGFRNAGESRIRVLNIHAPAVGFIERLRD